MSNICYRVQIPAAIFVILFPPHAKFCRSVGMDSWSEVQLKKMKVGGNANLNEFLKVSFSLKGTRAGWHFGRSAMKSEELLLRMLFGNPHTVLPLFYMSPLQEYGLTKNTNQLLKYNAPAAEFYKKKIQALAEDRPWHHPNIIEKSVSVNDANDFVPVHKCFHENDLGSLKSTSAHRRQQATPAHEHTSQHSDSPSVNFLEDIKPPQSSSRYVGFGSFAGRKDDTIDDYLGSFSAGVGNLSDRLGRVTAEATRIVGQTVRELHTGDTDQLHESAANAAQKSIEIGQRTWSGIKKMLSSTVNKLESFASVHNDNGSVTYLRSRISGQGEAQEHAQTEHVMFDRAIALGGLGEGQRDYPALARGNAVNELKIKDSALHSTSPSNRIDDHATKEMINSGNETGNTNLVLPPEDCGGCLQNTKLNMSKSNTWSDEEDGEDWGEVWGT